MAHALHLLGSSTLGKDPQTVNRLNGESFQQDALVTFNGEQSRLLLRIAVIADHTHRFPVRRVLDSRRVKFIYTTPVDISTKPAIDRIKEFSVGYIHFTGLQSNAG